MAISDCLYSSRSEEWPLGAEMLRSIASRCHGRSARAFPNGYSVVPRLGIWEGGGGTVRPRPVELSGAKIAAVDLFRRGPLRKRVPASGTGVVRKLEY